MRQLHLYHLQAWLSHHSRHYVSPYGSSDRGWRLPSQVTCQESITHLKGAGRVCLQLDSTPGSEYYVPLASNSFLPAPCWAQEELGSWLLGFSPSPPLILISLSFCLILHCPQLSSSLLISHLLHNSVSFSPIFLSFCPSTTSLPLGLDLHLPAVVFLSFLSFLPSLVLYKEEFHVTPTRNTVVSDNITRMPGCRTKKNFFKFISPGTESHI